VSQVGRVFQTSFLHVCGRFWGYRYAQKKFMSHQQTKGCSMT
jgi:hypothetical protein